MGTMLSPGFRPAHLTLCGKSESRMPLDRREFLGAAVVTVVSLKDAGAAPLADSAAWTILEPRPGSLSLLPKVETPILGYGGVVPGPLLRIKKGQGLKARLVNGLAEPTALTWHGVRGPNAMDGVPGLTQEPVSPGGRFDYTFIPPDSGLFWYHPHMFPVGPAQTARGLHGVLIVDEPDAPAVDHDLLMVIGDWSLDAAGHILPNAAAGTVVTVNARVATNTLAARPGARIRLRLLNVAAARIVLVGVVGAPTKVIAVDGQPSELFEPARGMVPIGPGSRFELMIDLPGTPGLTDIVMRGMGEPDRPLMHIKAEGAPLDVKPPIAKLPSNPLLPTRIPLERSLRRDVVLAVAPPSGGSPMRWSVNGAASDGVSGKPLFSVRRGGAVTLTFVNKTSDVQQMHIHGHVWRLLHDLDDGWDPYWRDSVLLTPGKTKHVAFIADNPGKWALVSSMLDRPVTGMATWFEVT